MKQVNEKVRVLDIKTEKVFLPQFYKDEATGIMKRSFVMRCKDCTIFQTKGGAACRGLGYCRFSKNYEDGGKSYSEQQRLRYAKILMDGYNNPRG